MVLVLPLVRRTAPTDWISLRLEGHRFSLLRVPGPGGDWDGGTDFMENALKIKHHPPIPNRDNPQQY
jgi:hypothetical protein